MSNRDQDNNAVVNAIILDPSLNPLPFQQEFLVPSRRLSINPRFDYAINDKNTLVARYSFTRSSVQNGGIGGTSLPTRAYQTKNTEHEIRLTETMIINPVTINETRFELSWDNRSQTGDNSIPTINVADAFTGGGAQIGTSFNRSHDWELQNYTTTTLGKNSQHSVKFGVRVRGTKLTDRSENNFGGTFSFPGFVIANDPNDPSDDVFVSPLEQYRQRVLGNTDPIYNPSQFSITAGNPQQSVSRTDLGLFATDDWRIRPDLTLSFGLRYENQTNISSNMNFAPRFSFAWSPGAGGAKGAENSISRRSGYFL